LMGQIDQTRRQLMGQIDQTRRQLKVRGIRTATVPSSGIWC